MNYAHWIVRVGTNTVDGLVALPFLAIAAVIDRPGAPSVLEVILAVVTFLLCAYNRWYLTGTTGQSWGRKLFGVRLVGDRTGRPVGVAVAFLRDVAHLLDGAFFFLGWLLPLVVRKRQTIADMICRTVVVKDLRAAQHAESRA